MLDSPRHSDYNLISIRALGKYKNGAFFPFRVLHTTETDIQQLLEPWSQNLRTETMFFTFIATLSTSVAALTIGGLSDSNVCSTIAASISGSVYYPTSLSPNYVQDIQHYMSSSTQQSQCVVEVASTQDISAVMKIVGPSRIPFAVKSGGHASNPGFSSTTGVHISLVRLKNVTLSADKSTATVGLGNVSNLPCSESNATGLDGCICKVTR